MSLAGSSDFARGRRRRESLCTDGRFLPRQLVVPVVEDLEVLVGHAPLRSGVRVLRPSATSSRTPCSRRGGRGLVRRPTQPVVVLALGRVEHARLARGARPRDVAAGVRQQPAARRRAVRGERRSGGAAAAAVQYRRAGGASMAAVHRRCGGARIFLSGGCLRPSPVGGFFLHLGRSRFSTPHRGGDRGRYSTTKPSPPRHEERHPEVVIRGFFSASPEPRHVRGVLGVGRGAGGRGGRRVERSVRHAEVRASERILVISLPSDDVDRSSARARARALRASTSVCANRRRSAARPRGPRARSPARRAGDDGASRPSRCCSPLPTTTAVADIVDNVAAFADSPAILLLPIGAGAVVAGLIIFVLVKAAAMSRRLGVRRWRAHCGRARAGRARVARAAF